MGILLPVQIVFWLASLTLLAASAATDLKERLIPNALVVGVAAIGVTLGLLVRPGALWLSLLAAASTFVALGVLSHYRIIGGGDLKLISAVTLLVPPERIGQLLIDIALAGGVLGCVYVAAHYGLKGLSATPAGVRGLARLETSGARTMKLECSRIAAFGPLPYGVAILCGVFAYATGEFLPCLSARSCSL